MAHSVFAWCYNELQLSPWRPKQQASLPFQALWKYPCPKDGVHFNHRPCSERSETWTLPWVSSTKEAHLFCFVFCFSGMLVSGFSLSHSLIQFSHQIPDQQYWHFIDTKKSVSATLVSLVDVISVFQSVSEDYIKEFTLGQSLKNRASYSSG